MNSTMTSSSHPKGVFKELSDLSLRCRSFLTYPKGMCQGGVAVILKAFLISGKGVVAFILKACERGRSHLS
jgi:hypothetical protein